MVNNKNYNGLKPGQYLQIGDSIKAIDTLPGWEQWKDATSKTQSAEALIRLVSWVYNALTKRRSQIQQTPVRWYRGETELEDTRLLGINPIWELARIDRSNEVYSVAYYHKLRNMSGRFLGLKWLDPATITPDELSVVDGEYTQYWRTTGTTRSARAERYAIPASDILRIYMPGLRELTPDISASQASSIDAQIVYGMGKTIDDFFDNGGLPVLFVDVPGNALEAMVNRLITNWKRILRRRADGQNKMIVTSGGATVTTLSLAPEQLDTTNISESRAEAITAAFGVPMGLLKPEGVNRATLEQITESFAVDVLGRIDLYLMQINEDADVAATGLMLKAHPERMEVFQRSRLVTAEALQRLVGGPIMTVNEARETIELEPITGGDELVQQNTGFGMLPEPSGDVPDPEPSKLWHSDMAALRTFIAKDNHYKRWFNSNELSDGEIMGEIMRLDPLFAQVKTVYP